MYTPTEELLAGWVMESKTFGCLLRKDSVTWKVQIWETAILKEEQGIGEGEERQTLTGSVK